MEINKVELWQSAGRLEEAMRSLGISKIRYSTDQKELADAVTLMGKGALGEHFKRSLNTLAPSNFMWIGAEDKDGNVVATIAARLDDTGSWSLKRFLVEHFCRVIDGEGGEPAQVNPGSAAFAENIFGKTVYIGETFCERDWRKVGLATMIAKYMILITWDEWKPEIIYAWIRRKQVESGAAVIWGATETYETPLMFDAPLADPDWADTFFVGVRRIGIHQMIQTLKMRAPRLASNNPQGKQAPPLF